MHHFRQKIGYFLSNLTLAAFAIANTRLAADPPPPSAPVLITDFAYSGANSDAEVAVNAQKGSKVYKDNDVTFPDLPAYLAGAEYVRPYFSDAGETSSTDQYQFDLTAASYVYLLIDSANDIPDNNDNDSYKWQKLPETIQLNGRTMIIYKSRLMQAKDNVYLATNGHGITKFDPKSNMYLVMVVPAGKATPAKAAMSASPAPGAK